jgi:hypothetical protein
MIALLRREPPGAHVSAIETRGAAPVALTGYRGDFAILHTI